MVNKRKPENQDTPNLKLSPQLQSKKQLSCPELIGSNHFINGINAIVERIKHSKSTILITGETGVGKTLIAKYLFFHSEVYKANLRSISLGEIPV